MPAALRVEVLQIARHQNISVRQRSCRWTTPSTRRSARDDDDRRDLPPLHEVQRLDGQHVAADGHGGARHHRGGALLEHTVVGHVAPKVAVRDDARQAALGIDDAGHAEALPGHLVDDVRHRGVFADRGELLAGVHQLIEPHQALAELPARMEVREVLLPEALAHEQRHRERVAQRQRRRGAGGRREVERARFLVHAAVERDVGRLPERRAREAGHGNHLRAHAANGLEQPENLAGLAAVRQRDHGVVRLQRAEVAVNGVGRVQEERGRAGARQRRGDLAADDARLAHAGQQHAAAAGGEQIDGGGERGVQAVDQPEDGVGLDAKDLPGQVEFGAHVGRGHAHLTDRPPPERRAESSRWHPGA